MGTTQVDLFSGTDRFTIRRRLGAGGMGVVYEAYDRERDQLIALKTILRLDPVTLYRFKREFRSLADLTHPNLVRLHELVGDGDHWFFTMELIDGLDFTHYVCPEEEVDPYDPIGESGLRTAVSIVTCPPTSTGASTQGGVPGEESTQSSKHSGQTPAEPQPSTHTDIPYLESTAVDVPDGSTITYQDRQLRSTIDGTPGSGSNTKDPAKTAEATATPQPDPRPRSSPLGAPNFSRIRSAMRQLAHALNALHAAGKLHRDLKPSNVLVTRRGRVVVLDFGLSTEVEKAEGHVTTEGQIVGTVAYMAPEQAGGQHISPATDWYSVGVMLYRALTGKLPFSGKALDVLMEKQRRDPIEPIALAAETPEELNRLCVELLSRVPENRPSGEEVLRRLGVEPAPESVAALTGAKRPFVGRERHLEELAEAYAALRRGETVVQFVHGRSGAGKSALVQRFLDDLLEHDEAVILAGRCYEQESVAYKALDTLIDSLSRFLRRLGRREAEALLPRDIHALARVFPVLRRVDAVAEAPQRVQEIPDQQELRRRAFGALRELLARISDRRPLLLYIDDLQWGDVDSASLLLDLLRPPDPPLLLLLCCYRSEYVSMSLCLKMLLDAAPGRRTLSVDPLTQRESRELAVRLIGQNDMAAQLTANLIASESGGSPFFVYELVQYLEQIGDISDSLMGSGSSNLSSTFSLDEVLWRRISHLPKEPQILLELLAVAGQPLHQANLCRAAGLRASGFEGLMILRSQHLVRGTGPGMLDDVETYHDRIRETVVKHLDPDVIKERHRQLAQELDGSPDVDPETLAIHFEAAGDAARAGHYYGLAARESARALAFDRAAKLYRRALELRQADDDESREYRVQLADALANAGRGVEAAHAYQDAAAGANATQLLELQRRAAYQYLISGHVDEGLSAFNDILRRVEIPLPITPRQALFRLLLSRAKLRLRGLRFRERSESRVPPADLERIDISRSVALGISVVDVIRGSDFQTRSLLLALKAGEPFRIAVSFGWEAVHSACSGRSTSRRTAKLLASAQSLANRIGHPHAIGMAALSHGATDYLEARYGGALASLDKAVEIFRTQCTGVVWELDTAHIFGLWTLIDLGNLKELRRRYLGLFQESLERGDRYLESTLSTYICALARLHSGEVAEAREQARDSMGRWSQHGFHIQHLNLYYGSIELDLYNGDYEDAWTRVLENRAAIAASLLPRIEDVRIDLLQHSGRCAIAAATRTTARSALLQSAEADARSLRRHKATKAEALAELLDAGAAAIVGDNDRSVSHLFKALPLFEQADMALLTAIVRSRLGTLLGGDRGRDLLAESSAWMTEQGVKDPRRLTACYAPGFAE